MTVAAFVGWALVVLLVVVVVKLDGQRKRWKGKAKNWERTAKGWERLAEQREKRDDAGELHRLELRAAVDRLSDDLKQ